MAKRKNLRYSPPPKRKPTHLELAERAIAEIAARDHTTPDMVRKHMQPAMLNGLISDDPKVKAEVIKDKAKHPGVSLYLMLAYLPKEGQTIDREGCDGVIYPEGMETVPYQVAIPRLNQLVIGESDHLIAYVTHSWGGAAQTLEYARKRERRGLLTVTDLADVQIPSKCVSC